MSISKLFASAASAALLIGLAAGSSAQAADPEPQQQASAPATTQAPPLPLGHGDIREVQNQLIALGYNPGPADGQIGPATTMAADQYDASHGGSGNVAVDGALLARLKADTGPRLSYEQVEARAGGQGGGSTQSSGSAPAASSGASQVGGIVSQIVPLIGQAIANSNANNAYYGPAYYGPPPGYYRGYYGYGGF
jgi:hypothetical protein